MPPPHRDFKERSVALAIAHPWASASSCLLVFALRTRRRFLSLFARRTRHHCRGRNPPRVSEREPPLRLSLRLAARALVYFPSRKSAVLVPMRDGADAGDPLRMDHTCSASFFKAFGNFAEVIS